jgi:hypothetical protein
MHSLVLLGEVPSLPKLLVDTSARSAAGGTKESLGFGVGTEKKQNLGALPVKRETASKGKEGQKPSRVDTKPSVESKPSVDVKPPRPDVMDRVYSPLVCCAPTRDCAGCVAAVSCS